MSMQDRMKLDNQLDDMADRIAALESKLSDKTTTIESQLAKLNEDAEGNFGVLFNKLLRTQLTIAAIVFSKLILNCKPNLEIPLFEQGGNKILKSRSHPAKCIQYLFFVLVLMEIPLN